MSLRPLAIGCALFFLSSASGRVADQRLRPERALTWRANDYPEATLHIGISYLEPAREWERMDIWVPRKPADEKLPCVVLLYGSAPDPTSPRYLKPLTASPGQTLRAITIHEHLEPSRIATARFAPGPQAPAITTAQRTFEAELGKPFRVVFEAAHAAGASWFIGGKSGEHYREYGGRRFNPPRHVPWMRMEAKTGVLSGTPRTFGRFPVIVSCMTGPTGSDEHPQSEGDPSSSST